MDRGQHRSADTQIQIGRLRGRLIGRGAGLEFEQIAAVVVLTDEHQRGLRALPMRGQYVPERPGDLRRAQPSRPKENSAPQKTRKS